jgi:pilus assembly protein CpaB
MNRRFTIILLSAFLVAATCSYVVYRAVGTRLTNNQPKTTRVLVTTGDIKVGAILRDTDIASAETLGAAPKGAILRREDALGRGVISDLYQGEPILDSRLAAVGSGGGLAATIPQGMRACAIKVDEVVGVAGFVTPGSHVDVLIDGVPPNSSTVSEGTRVKTLLQNIAVLSAGQDIQKSPDGKPNPVQVVNLLVTPEDAELLSLASNQTHIQLVLRNPLDTQVAKTPGSAMGHLFGDTTPFPKIKRVANSGAPQPQPHSFVVEVFNGSKRSEDRFGSSEKNQ